MSTYSVAVLADTPDAYYRMGETGATAFADSSGNARTLTKSGGTWPVTASLINTDAADGAATFPGTVKPANTAVTISQQPMTVEFWINQPSAGGAQVSCHTAANGWYVSNTATQWAFIFTTVSVLLFSAALAPPTYGTKQHVAFVVKASNAVDLYLNGVLKDTQTAVGPIIAATGVVRVGDYFNSAPVPNNTIMDEVAIYKSELTAGQIAAHYAAATNFPPVTGTQSFLLSGVGT